MADLLEAANGFSAVAEALLGANGRTVSLRMPTPPVPGDATEELGLVTPQFSDVGLFPCVFRKAGSQRELLVSAAAVAQIVGSLQFSSAAVLFATAAGVMVDDVLLNIVASSVMEQGGIAICYRLTLSVEN